MRKVNIRRSICILLFSISFLLVPLSLIVSCSTGNTSPMRVGTNLWPGYEPLYLARELGYWGGNDIKLAEFPSSSEVIRAFRNQSLDAAALTLDEVLLLWQQNIEAEIVLILDVSSGADAIIADSTIKTFADLKGKTVAVESSALGAYVISRALEINSMSLNDVTIMSLGVSDHESAFNNGEVQAAVTFEPVRTKLLESGGNEIFTSHEIPGEIVDVLVIQRGYLQKYPHQAKKLAQGWFQAIEYMRTRPSDSAERIAKRLKITPEDVTLSYEGLDLAGRDENIRMLVGEEAELNQTLKKLAKSMLKSELLNSVPALNEIINDNVVR